ncbi:hypothetical protein WHI96_08645 [Pseudonocardia tropica]|uniref:Uncharacterized protein n=1 Tax=Pseudonocardia tropica TaxID=681289 RepID=A0ABV1JSG5_9PSEU
MTDMWDDLVEAPDATEILGDLHEVATSVFDLCYDGSEPEWAAWAWSILTRAGLAAAGTEYERGELVLRLLALNMFHRELCARTLDLGVPGEWDVDPDRVLGDHPRLHPVLLGVIVERRSLDLADSTDPGDLDFDVSVAATALDALVRSEYRRVVPLLVTAVGPVDLAASVWASTRSEVRFPLPDSEVRALTGDPTPRGRAAIDWVRGGARRS